MPIDFSLLIPELLVVGVVTVLALLEILLPEMSRRLSGKLNLLGVFLVALSLVGGSGRSGTTFDGMFASDAFALFFKFLFLGAAAVVFLMRRPEGAEFHLILWSALLGMFFLVSAKDFLLFFISFELMTLSLYILAAYSGQDVGGERAGALPSIEAGLKYLVLGSLASAFLLYGISLLYAASGTLSFEELGDFVAQSIEAGRPVPLLFLAGSLLILSALGFKVASVPFQVWVPDVYQGAPTPVTAFFSVASKSAGFAALGRILFEILGSLDNERRVLFSLFAAMTLLYGNLGALLQRDIKRLLGYSSIGHAGFLLVALASQKLEGESALFYYLLAYAVTNLTAFLVVSVVEGAERSQQIEAFRGLARRSPILAAAMFVALLSLAGVPPLGGFFAKFFILLVAAKSGLFWLVFLGAVNVAISLYYYLSVVRVIYVEKPKVDSPIALSLPLTAVLFLLMAGIVLIGVWQAPFFRFVSQAAASLF